MTATARLGNVLYVDFPTSFPPPELVGDDPWWPRTGTAVEAVSGKTPAATRRLPARWSPRPCRVMALRFARSRLVADLKTWAWLLGLLIAGVLCVVYLHPAIDLIPAGVHR